MVSFVEILRLSRENISKFEDAGCGMYNLYLPSNEMLSFPHEGDIVFQIYPFKEDMYYATCYVHFYNTDIFGNTDSCDIAFTALQPSDRYIIEEMFFDTLGLRTEEKRLTDDQKAINLISKIRLATAILEKKCSSLSIELDFLPTLFDNDADLKKANHKTAILVDDNLLDIYFDDFTVTYFKNKEGHIKYQNDVDIFVGEGDHQYRYWCDKNVLVDTEDYHVVDIV